MPGAINPRLRRSLFMAKKLPVRERMIASANRKIKSREKKLQNIVTAHEEHVASIRDEIAEQRELLKALGVRKRR